MLANHVTRGPPKLKMSRTWCLVPLLGKHQNAQPNIEFVGRAGDNGTYTWIMYTPGRRRVST